MRHFALLYECIERKYISNLVLTLSFIILASICGVSLPIVLKKIVDQLTINHHVVPVGLFAIYAFILISERFFNEIQFISYYRWENGVIRNFFNKIFSLLFHNKPDFFNQHLHGSITGKIYQALFGLDSFMFDIIFKVIPISVSLILILSTIAIVFDYQMSLIIGAGSILYVYLMYQFNNKIIAHQNTMRNNYNQVQGLTTDAINSWKDIKLMNSYGFVNMNFNKMINSITEKTNTFYKMRGFYGFLQSLPICAMFMIVNYYAVSRYVQGISTLGGIVLINNYLLQILRPLEAFSLLFRGLTKSYSDFIAIDEIISESKESIENQPSNIFINDITIENLAAHDVLKNLNLSVKRGEKIAIIGASGSGKTTLLNTLTGINQNFTGDILINNKSIREISASTLRHNIAYMPSDARLIQDSIINNLLMGKVGDVLPILHDSCILEKIASLAKGVNTLVSENATHLSTGEKQRLKIARTSLLQKDIVLYDEATSALNIEIENKIIENLLADKHKTVIFVTHKEGHLYKFDKIYKLENGYLKDHSNEYKPIVN